MAEAAFRPTGVYKRMAYKPHRGGGMLIQYRVENIFIYCVSPDEMPTALTKNTAFPSWHGYRGYALDLRGLVDRDQRHRQERQLAVTIGAPYGPHPELEAREKFLDCFDPRHLALVTPFGESGWTMYTTLRRCAGFEELLVGGDRSRGRTGDTALAFALAHLWQREDAPTQPLRTVRRLLRRKRREIADALGFVSGTGVSAVKTLSRVTTRCMSTHRLHQLKLLLGGGDRDVIRMLSHAPRINADVLEILGNPRLRALVKPTLLWEASMLDPVRAFTAGCLEDTHAMAAARGATLPIIRDTAHLHALHNEEVERQLRRTPIDDQLPLPPAPIPGIPGVIEYVSSSVGALEREGDLMQHCVGTYAPRVARGDVYIYRLLEPQRCTIAIGRGHQGHLQLREVRRAHNRHPSPASFAVIERWLQPHVHARLPEVDPQYAQAFMAARYLEQLDDPFGDDDIPF